MKREVQQTGHCSAQDDWKSGCVDHDQAAQHGLIWPGALCGVRIGQQMAESVHRVAGPRKQWAGE